MSTYTRPYNAVTASIRTLAATSSPQNSYVVADPARRATITFDLTGSSSAFISYGTVATTSSYTAKLNSGDKLREDLYKGPISVIFSGTTGSLNITDVSYIY